MWTKREHPLSLGRVLHNVRLGTVRPPEGHTGKPEAGAPGAGEPEEAEEAFRQGLAEGRAEALKEIQSAVAALRAVAAHLDRERAALARQADEQGVTLALAVASRILDREIERPEYLHGLLTRALAQVPSKTALRVRLNPHDLARLEALRDIFQKGPGALPEDLLLVPDPSLRPGGCLLEGPAGGVDARLETQLVLVEKALRSAPDAEIVHEATSLEPGRKAPAHS